MKPTFLLLLLILGISCKKENHSIQKSIVGTWELRTIYSGWGGTSQFPAGNRNILQFTQTEYRSYTNGQLDRSGTYRIIKDTTMYNKIEDRIIYDQGLDPLKVFISIEDSILNLSVDAVDGGGKKYRRIQ